MNTHSPLENLFDVVGDLHASAPNAGRMAHTRRALHTVLRSRAAQLYIYDRATGGILKSSIKRRRTRLRARSIAGCDSTAPRRSFPNLNRVASCVATRCSSRAVSRSTFYHGLASLNLASAVGAIWRLRVISWQSLVTTGDSFEQTLRLLATLERERQVVGRQVDVMAAAAALTKFFTGSEGVGEIRGQRGPDLVPPIACRDRANELMYPSRCAGGRKI